MKKKIFGAVVVAIAVGAMTNINLSLNHSNKYSALTMKSIESLASPEGQICVTDPSKNWGVCNAKSNGFGYECVTPGIWDEEPNCVAVY